MEIESSNKKMYAKDRLKDLTTLVALVALFSGCSSYESSREDPVQIQGVALSEQDQIATGALNRRTVTVPPITIDDETEPEKEFRVGPDDELTINVNGERTMEALVLRVDSNGFVQLPIVNRINVMGRTVSEIQDALITAYSKEFIDPWVVVSISKYRSRPVYVLGELKTPGVMQLERPTNIMQALGLAGGTTESAYLKRARLLRDGRILAVDIEAMLNQGQFEQNIWLKSGDTIFVPGTQDLTVYVLGAVDTPGEQPFQRGIGTLAAISSAGGVIGGQARLTETRIVRTHSPLEGELITVDIASVLRGKRPDFPLEPGDIIYVPNSPLGNWNEVIEQIAPTFRLVSDVLEPFVQIEFLIEETQ